jgi:hypothetical protein
MQTPKNTTLTASVSPNDSYYLPGGFGCWDVTSFPFGGDFIRPKSDLALTNLRPSEKAGYMLADAAYPPRRGVRTLCIQSIHIKGQ